MKLRQQDIVYVLDPDEQFDVERHWSYNGTTERFRVETVHRYVYEAQGGGYGLILRTMGPLIRKDGQLSKRRRGGVDLLGHTDPDIAAAAAVIELMPPGLAQKLAEVGFWYPVED